MFHHPIERIYHIRIGVLIVNHRAVERGTTQLRNLTITDNAQFMLFPRIFYHFLVPNQRNDFFEDILECLILVRQLGVHAFVLREFRLKLLHFLELRRFHAASLRFPVIIRRYADVVLVLHPITPSNPLPLLCRIDTICDSVKCDLFIKSYIITQMARKPLFSHEYD